MEICLSTLSLPVTHNISECHKLYTYIQDYPRSSTFPSTAKCLKYSRVVQKRCRV